MSNLDEADLLEGNVVLPGHVIFIELSPINEARSGYVLYLNLHDRVTKGKTVFRDYMETVIVGKNVPRRDIFRFLHRFGLKAATNAVVAKIETLIGGTRLKDNGDSDAA